MTRIKSAQSRSPSVIRFLLLSLVPADLTDRLGSSLKIVSAVGLLLRFLPQTKRTLRGCGMAGGGLGECPAANVGRQLADGKQPGIKNVGRHNECCDGLLFPPEQFHNIPAPKLCNIFNSTLLQRFLDFLADFLSDLRLRAGRRSRSINQRKAEILRHTTKKPMKSTSVRSCGLSPVDLWNSLPTSALILM